MAAMILVQGVLGASLTSRADAEARSVFASSLESVREVSRIAHDIDEERVLVNQHILEEDVPAMNAMDARLAALRKDIREASQRYDPLIVLAGERALWMQARELDGRFDRSVDAVLELSRANKNIEARARLTVEQKAHIDLDGKLVDLIRMNLAGASQAMEGVRALQERAERMQWATRIAGLSFLLLFGVWGTRRIVRYERQITDYALEIEERNRDLDAFAGRVAHDLRNALSPIVLSPSMLKASASTPAQVERIADRIDRCSERAISVVDSLLAFSRATQAVDANEHGSLAAAMRSVEEELAPEIARLGVSFASEVIDVNVRCTPGLLHVVLANLCGNAVKYLEAQAERRVRVSAYAENGFCCIHVEDTGPGIAKELQTRIFEPFFRVEGTVARGTGIGLATVRRIVEARDGDIAVHSAAGQGCRFVVRLPLATVSAVAAIAQ